MWESEHQKLKLEKLEVVFTSVLTILPRVRFEIIP